MVIGVSMDTDRIKNTTIFLVGALTRMSEFGLAQGGKMRASPEGMKMFDSLVAEGFRPTIEEISEALRFLGDEIGVEEKDFPLVLITVGNWDQFVAWCESKKHEWSKKDENEDENAQERSETE